MRLSSFMTCAVLFATSLAVRADSFNFAFGNSSSPFSGSGVLTTGDAVAPGEYLIKSISGTAATSPLGANLVIASILTPGTFPTPANGGTFPANDNTLFVTNGVGSLDGYGLAFILGNGAQINLYSANGSADDALLERNTGKTLFEDVPITITQAAPTPTPELSSFTLLATGLVGVAGLVRRRLASTLS